MTSQKDGANIANSLLTENITATLATASMEGAPEASTIHFVLNGHNDIYFTSFPTYQKYTNLKTNNRAAMVIFDGENSLQIEGTVKELPLESRKEAIRLLIMKYGYGEDFYKDNDLRMFQLNPTWERLVVSKPWPPEFIEVKEGKRHE